MKQKLMSSCAFSTCISRVDTTLGANAFVERLRSHMVRVFNLQKKSKQDIGQDAKALRKLWIAAESTLQVLSANNEDLLQVGSLIDDKDYSAKVSRTELEQLCADLFERLAQPLRTALRAAHFESFVRFFFGFLYRIPLCMMMNSDDEFSL